MKQSHAFPAFDAIKPWLRRNLVDLNTTVFATYDDKRLMANSSGAIIVVGTAKRITQETIGFLIEIDHARILLTKQFRPPRVATWHKQDALKAIEANRSLISIMEARERTTKPSQHKKSNITVTALVSAEFAKKNCRFEELDKNIQEAIILEASLFGRIPRIVEAFYETASQIYKSNVRATEQTRCLIEAWRQRGDLFRHSFQGATPDLTERNTPRARK